MDRLIGPGSSTVPQAKLLCKHSIARNRSFARTIDLVTWSAISVTGMMASGQT
jgi:hypothetical protein